MKRTFLIILISVFFLGSVLSAQEMKPQQRQRLKNIGSRTNLKTQESRVKIMRLREELATLYKSDKIDEPKARQIINNIANTQLQLLNTNLENQIQLRTVLSEEQFMRLANKIGKNIEGVKERPESKFQEKNNFRGKQNNIILQLRAKRQDIMKSLKQDSNQLIDVYSKYQLDKDKAKDIINKIHNSQVSLLKLEHDFQKRQPNNSKK